MKAEYVNAFLQSAAYTLNQIGEEDVRLGSITAKGGQIPAFQVGIFLGVMGDLAGEVMFLMNNEVGRGLASRMMNQEVQQIGSIEQSALGEFGNIVAGGGITRLSSSGLDLNLSPPVVLVGDDVFVQAPKVKTISVKVMAGFGEIEIGVGLVDRRER